jgi:hypothetical protein
MIKVHIFNIIIPCIFLYPIDNTHYSDFRFSPGCDDCQMLVKDQCLIHGNYTVVHDRIIPSRARLTAPHFLSVRKVTYIAGGEEDGG